MVIQLTTVNQKFLYKKILDFIMKYSEIIKYATGSGNGLFVCPYAYLNNGAFSGSKNLKSIIFERNVSADDSGVFADWEFDDEKFDNVNPKIKNTVLSTVLLFLFLLPAKYEIYAGNNGNIHGDIKLAIPSNRVKTYSIINPYLLT